MAELREVDLGGDIWLLVGTEGSQFRIRASKALLQYTSDYFRVLLGSNFREGSSAEAGKEVVLADDDGEAFALLCKVLHMRCRSPPSPTADQLVALAVVAGKYGCVDSLWLSTDFLFSTSGCCSSSYDKMIEASYLLDCPKMFKDYTKRMIFNSTPSLLELATSEHGSLLPTMIWRQAERTAEKSCKHLSEVLVSPCTNFNDPCPSAVQWSRKMAEELHKLGVTDKPFEGTVAEIGMRLGRIDVPTAPGPQCPKTGEAHRPIMRQGEFRSKAWALDNREAGLCLDCVRGRAGNDGKCRFDHG